MKLKTSFFNATVLKKDITRFAPVWGIYSIYLMLFYVTQWLPVAELPRHTLIPLESAVTSSSYVNLIYAWICAMVLFGDLYKPQRCNALHALPIRREGWFLSHVVAALLFCAVPNTLFAVFISPLLAQNWYLAFVWLGISLLQFIAMFGVATFAAMCAGNRLGLLIAYAELHIWPTLVVGFIYLFYHSVLYGFANNLDILADRCPISYYFSTQYIKLELHDPFSPTYGYQGLIPRDFLIIGLLALVSVGLLVGALLIYRSRKLETAGDFMANRPAAVVFQALFSMYFGGVFYSICREFFEAADFIMGLLGIALGFFAGSMLLQRKVNVFTKKNTLVCGLVVAFVAVSVMLTAADPLGLTKKLPEKDQIKSVVVYEGSDGYYFPDPLISVEKPQDTEAVLKMHQKLIEDRPETSEFLDITFVYELIDGSTFKRSYPILEEDLDQSAMREIYSNWENLFDTSDWEKYTGSVTGIYIYPQGSDEISLIIAEDFSDYSFPRYCRKVPMDENSREKVLALMQTMKEECSTRPMIPDSYDFYRFKSDYLVIIQTQEDGEIVNRRILVNRGCVQTNAVIEELMEAYYVY